MTVWQIRGLATTAKLGHFARHAQSYSNIDIMLDIYCSKRTSLFLSGASRQTADSPNRHPPIFITVRL